MKQKLLLYFILLIFSTVSYGQINVGLYEQFNGRYDFTFVGNTLNLQPNGTNIPCEILTTSSATLALERTDRVLRAYMYWAGSGTGDFDVKLNGQEITANRRFPVIATTGNIRRPYFSAFADVTSIVAATGNGLYTLSDLDLTSIINQTTPTSQNLYCQNGTNFGGWAIIVVYENPALPLNQLNLYDGLQYVPTEVNISLPSLNVVDNVGAKIGFLAWEGDENIYDAEQLKINGLVLSDPPLNPRDNAFNCTNSITRSNQLHNMDLDVYNIQNFINIGDETADIRLESGRDFVMINAVITKLNSQLPDATITVENITKQCASRVIIIDYTIHNVNSTDVLPAGTTVGIYVNTELIATTQTVAAIPIGGSESGTITLTIPANVPRDFELLFFVDHNRVITETDETNNVLIINETLWLQSAPVAQDIHACQTVLGNHRGLFNFSGYAQSLMGAPDDVVTFYTSAADAQVPRNPISLTNAAAYMATGNPQEIYVRVEDSHGCTAFTSFTLITDDCLFPDATVSATYTETCNSRNISITYTVANIDGFAPLPAGTRVGIYADTVLLTTVTTTAIIPIGGTQTATTTVTIPANIPLNFNLRLIADDGNAVRELAETNNIFTIPIELWVSPVIQQPQDITACETGPGSTSGIFDFSAYEQSLKTSPTDVVTFYTTQAFADAGGNNNIGNPANYTSNGTNPQPIYVRLENEHGCYSIGVFMLIVDNCLLPDATITAGNIVQACDLRSITVSYTISNLNSFDNLPAGTPIGVYIGTQLLATVTTRAVIIIGGNETATINLTIPADVPQNFSLTFIADDGNAVTETIETNNTFTLPVFLWVSPILQQPADVTACETFNGSGIGIFDFSEYLQLLKNNPNDVVTFHATQQEAINGTSDITDANAHTSVTNKTIFVRLEDEHGCYDVKSFKLVIRDCYFPDATVVIEDVYKQCNSRVIHVHYTVNNFNATDVLPAGTPVSVYANGEFLDYTETLDDLAIGESESNYITLTIPIGIPLDFNLMFVADDTGTGTGIVVEIDETNNSNTLPTSLVLSPILQEPADIVSCDQGFGKGTFDFSAYAESLKNYDNETITFYHTQQTADQAIEAISNTSQYETSANPERIYVRLDNGTCHTTASFLLLTKKCAPTTYNYVTPNNDTYNDTFFVKGLRNIFLNFKMSIYNRWGSLIWTGRHSDPDWDGIANVDKVGSQNSTVPTGTYYFVLELNDPDFPEPIVGWVYVTL